MIEESMAYSSGKHFAQEVVETLRTNAIDLEDEQTFALYLYVASEPVALQCQTQIQAHGCNCEVEESAAEDGSWLCYITTSKIVPSEAVLEPLGTLLLELAKAHNGEFDGWEIEQNFEDLTSDFPSLMDFSEPAKNILDTIRNNFCPNHEFVTASLQDFTDLDHSFYQTAQAGFAELGYLPLADTENRTISAQGTRTLIRTLYHPALKSVAVAYYVPALEAGIFEIESFLSDGTVAISTIAPAGYEIATWPLIDSKHYASEIGISQLHGLHQKHVEQLLVRKAGVTVRSVATLDEFIVVQNQMTQHKHEHLKKIGWVTREYLLIQAGGDELVAEGVFEAIQELLSTEETVQT